MQSRLLSVKSEYNSKKNKNMTSIPPLRLPLTTRQRNISNCGNLFIPVDRDDGELRYLYLCYLLIYLCIAIASNVGRRQSDTAKATKQ